MKDEIILNKKKSIINSIVIPIVFMIIYIVIYNFMPNIKINIDENLGKQFIKGAFLLAGIITTIISMTTFWGNEFFSEKRYKKNEMVLLKRKAEIISTALPVILGIILIIFMYLLPIPPKSDLLFIKYMKNSIFIAVAISMINSIIIFWLIVLFSKEEIKNEK